jgi:TM2 domain-containing membrane protein YozV
MTVYFVLCYVSLYPLQWLNGLISFVFPLLSIGDRQMYLYFVLCYVSLYPLQWLSGLISFVFPLLGLGARQMYLYFVWCFVVSSGLISFTFPLLSIGARQMYLYFVWCFVVFLIVVEWPDLFHLPPAKYWRSADVLVFCVMFCCIPYSGWVAWSLSSSPYSVLALGRCTCHTMCSGVWPSFVWLGRALSPALLKKLSSLTSTPHCK